MIFIYIIGYINYWFHILFSGHTFPLAYHVMAPMGLIMALIVVGQTFYYNNGVNKRVYLSSVPSLSESCHALP